MTVCEAIVGYVIGEASAAALVPPGLFAEPPDAGEAAACRTLNAAFLIELAGSAHPEFVQARTRLREAAATSDQAELARFYLDAAAAIAAELDGRMRADLSFRATCDEAVRALAAGPADRTAAREIIWSVLFPEGTGLRSRTDGHVAALRRRRTVRVRTLNPDPIRHPAAEVLFTSNVLLTTPLTAAAGVDADSSFQARLDEAAREPQRYWYDHPVPVGISAERNEILYGLRHLEAAVAEERRRHPGAPGRVACVLSVSVTHTGLQALARSYLGRVLSAGPRFDHLDVFAFTEADTESLVQRVLLPIVSRCRPREDAANLLSVIGVDGRYGRHYSFLKAVAALWQVLVDPAVRATFKIDLDQVFPQRELAEQTGRTAFEHLQTPLWGAVGEDAFGQPVELGMLAGTLVNQRDIHRGLFTPDVTFPHGDLAPDELVFFSRLPQALSTEAEMTARGDVGAEQCLERIHVTGGTNGILVDALRRFRPFTPSFVGRAEDQAYVFSTFGLPVRLGYVHAPGLVMRHDKEGFAEEAMAAAAVGKEIGDYERILVFSAYARSLACDVESVKSLVDPFTGCFISKVPATVALLRFALRVAAEFSRGRAAEAMAFAREGVKRLRAGMDLTAGDPSPLRQAYGREREGWQLYYDSLDDVERALAAGEAWAESVRREARRLVADCRVTRPPG